MTVKELETRLVPIDSLKLYKGNARIGNVEVVRESLRKNGQYRPVVVRKQTSEILCGNHTWKAAKAEGYDELWATFIECTTTEAKRINLVDNRAPELGGYDQEALVELLQSLPDLEGTGFTSDDLEKELQKLQEGELPDVPGPDDVPDDDYVSQYGVVVVCEDPDKQESVYNALVKLVRIDPAFENTELKIVAI